MSCPAAATLQALLVKELTARRKQLSLRTVAKRLSGPRKESHSLGTHERVISFC